MHRSFWTVLAAAVTLCLLPAGAAATGVGQAPPMSGAATINVPGTATWRVYSGPAVTWRASTPLLRRQTLVIQRFLARSRMPFRLREAAAGTTPDINVGVSRAYACRAGRWQAAGFGGPGRAVVGANCRGQLSMSVLAHELGHALGLAHVVNGCAVMNPGGISNAAQTTVRPNRCPRFHDWARRPFLPSDLARLRAHWRNRAPVAGIRLGKNTWQAFENLRATDAADDGLIDTTVDPDWNLASQSIDWGDGSPTDQRIPARWVNVPNWAAHSYDAPGTYVITMSATDTYGVSHSASTTIEVVGTPGTVQDPIWVD